MAKAIEEKEPTLEDVKSAVTIEPMALQEEFVRLPGDLSYWHHQYAKKMLKAKNAYAERKRMEAEVRLAVRSSGEKMNEATVDAMVETHADVVAARKLEAETEAAQALAWGVVDSVRAKASMLQSLGAHLRAEQDPVTKHAKDQASSR